MKERPNAHRHASIYEKLSIDVKMNFTMSDLRGFIYYQADPSRKDLLVFQSFALATNVIRQPKGKGKAKCLQGTDDELGS